MELKIRLWDDIQKGAIALCSQEGVVKRSHLHKVKR
jgi:hypothetical protein